MQVLSKINLKIVAIIFFVSFFCLINLQQAHSQLSLPKGFDVNKLTPDTANSLKSQIESQIKDTIDTAIKPYTTQFQGYINQVNKYQKDIERYQTQIVAVPNQIREQVDKSVNSIEGRVQTNINGISTKASEKIKELEGSVNKVIKETIEAIAKHLFVGDVLVKVIINGLAALGVAWYIKWELDKTLKAIKKQIDDQLEDLTDKTNGIATNIEKNISGITTQFREAIDPLDSP